MDRLNPSLSPHTIRRQTRKPVLPSFELPRRDTHTLVDFSREPVSQSQACKATQCIGTLRPPDPPVAALARLNDRPKGGGAARRWQLANERPSELREKDEARGGKRILKSRAGFEPALEEGQENPFYGACEKTKHTVDTALRL
ncbi:hypothetical protein ACHAQJ_006968 [Trichoderma viride]